MKQEKDDMQIIRDFKVRQSRQFLAIAVTLLLLVLLALLHQRPTLFGEFSKNTIFVMQLVVIAVFISFSAYNWRCPSCKKYLGKNIDRHTCKQCGTRLR